MHTHTRTHRFIRLHMTRPTHGLLSTPCTFLPPCFGLQVPLNLECLSLSSLSKSCTTCETQLIHFLLSFPLFFKCIMPHIIIKALYGSLSTTLDFLRAEIILYLGALHIVSSQENIVIRVLKCSKKFFCLISKFRFNIEIYPLYLPLSIQDVLDGWISKLVFNIVLVSAIPLSFLDFKLIPRIELLGRSFFKEKRPSSQSQKSEN